MSRAKADQFVASVQQYVDKQKRDPGLFFRALCLAALARVKELTPVLTGRARAGWELDPPVEAIEAGMRVSITNPVVYVRRLDEGFVGTDSLGRQYHQRGAHMVEKTIAALPELAEQVKKDLK